MKSLEKLSNVIKEDPRVIRLKELEKVINNSTNAKRLHESVIKYQKELVNAREKGLNYQNILQKYNETLKSLYDYPLITEYLDLIEDVNNDLQYLSAYIEKRIQIDIDE